MVWCGPPNPRRRGCLDCVGDYKEFWVNIWSSFHSVTSVAGLARAGRFMKEDTYVIHGTAGNVRDRERSWCPC